MVDETKVAQAGGDETNTVANAANTPQEEKKDGGKKDGGKKGGQREQQPIEDLYDLSKPIPKVDRPSKEAHETEIKNIGEAMDAIKEERNKLQQKIDDTMEKGRNSEISREKDALSKLRAQKSALINEKKTIRSRLDIYKNQNDKLQKDRKDTKSGIKFTKLEDIDAEIKKLQKKQETTSMSLNEEKKLIKEMDALHASKKLVADLKGKDAAIGDVHEQKKAIAAELKMKDAEIDELSKVIDERQSKIKTVSDKETDKKAALQKLFDKREDLKKQMNAKAKERDECRKVFREKTNDWYQYKRAIRAQQQIEYEAEKKRREEERAEWLKKKEEEELKKTPYEEEMALCDYLANYLTDTYLTDDAEKQRQKEEEAEKKKNAGVVAVKEDPFAGMKAVSKKDDDEEEYFGKGKKGSKSKKKSRATKAKEKGPAKGPFTLNVDTFEQFGLLQLTPPTSVEMVAKSVEDLKAKKQWYSEQPRGSVKTAAEIRKEAEKAAAKLKQDKQAANGEGSNHKKKQGGGGGGFDLSSDDFAPLGAGSTSSNVSSSTWGERKPAAADAAEAPAADN